MTSMKAVVYEQYGPPEVLQLRDVDKPEPKDNEVLIKIHATTVTAGDFRVRSLDVPVGFRLLARLALGIFGPRQPILGSELAGVVEAVGKDVRQFKVGDAVFAFGDARMGCHAEYRCMPEDGLVAHKPSNLSYEEAAALSFGGTTALYFLRKANIQPGERVLVNGASGSVGSACVQLARRFGAEVTGVCSTANVEMVRSLGAAHVVDYTNEDFTQNGQIYDVIVDTVGTAPFSRSKDSLAERGRLLLVFGTLPQQLQIPWLLLTSKKKVMAGVSLGKREELEFLAKLAEAGEFKPVIGRKYPLDQIVEAHRYVDSGHKRGNVIITLAH
jgi:NADPH:quinone reductase-like Zn-dependent oxidoreductase